VGRRLYRLYGVSPNRVFGAPPDFERNVLVAGRILKVEDGRVAEWIELFAERIVALGMARSTRD